jgi:SAM-dependent methyltransferase
MTRPLARLLRPDVCNVCGSRSRFRSFGDPPRRRAQCRRCGSLERHRALWSWLERQLPVGARVLHSAPEPALYRKLRARSDLDYVTTELAPGADSIDPAMVRADLQNLPFESGAFDVVVCSHVLEHVPDDGKAMREIRRVLTPRGLAALQVPVDERDSTYDDERITAPEARRSAFGQADHVRLYGRDFRDRLRAAGFDVAVIPADSRGSDVYVARPADAA